MIIDNESSEEDDESDGSFAMVDMDDLVTGATNR